MKAERLSHQETLKLNEDSQGRKLERDREKDLKVFIRI